jgi:hypothetical protein
MYVGVLHVCVKGFTARYIILVERLLAPERGALVRGVNSVIDMYLHIYIYIYGHVNTRSLSP